MAFSTLLPQCIDHSLRFILQILADAVLCYYDGYIGLCRFWFTNRNQLLCTIRRQSFCLPCVPIMHIVPSPFSLTLLSLGSNALFIAHSTVTRVHTHRSLHAYLDIQSLIDPFC